MPLAELVPPKAYRNSQNSPAPMVNITLGEDISVLAFGRQTTYQTIICKRDAHGAIVKYSGRLLTASCENSICMPAEPARSACPHSRPGNSRFFTDHGVMKTIGQLTVATPAASSLALCALSRLLTFGQSALS